MSFRDKIRLLGEKFINCVIPRNADMQATKIMRYNAVELFSLELRLIKRKHGAALILKSSTLFREMNAEKIHRPLFI